ncbi:hypothetical protein [Clostridium sp.]|nr:hypothetical protein [Clostridium sp.]
MFDELSLVDTVCLVLKELEESTLLGVLVGSIIFSVIVLAFAVT